MKQAKAIINGFSSSFVLLGVFFPFLINVLSVIGIELLPNKPARFFKRFVESAMVSRQKEESGPKRHDFIQLVIEAEESPDEDLKVEGGRANRKGLTSDEIQVMYVDIILKLFPRHDNNNSCWPC